MSKKVQVFHTFVTRQSPEVQSWITQLDNRLSNDGCKVVAKLHTGDGAVLDYVSKKTKMRVCKLEFRASECTLTLCGNHFVDPKNIIGELSDEMLHSLKYMTGCKPCFTPPLCGMNYGRYFAFTHNGEYYECCGGGFRFKLSGISGVNVFDRWIDYELAWSGEGALVNLELKNKLAKSMKKNNDSLTAVPIYEQTNKQQNLNRPTVDGTCEYFLKDTALKEGAERLIAVCRELGAEPKWISKNKFEARKLAVFRCEGPDDYNVCVNIADNTYYEPSNFGRKFFSMPSDFVSGYIENERTHCSDCTRGCDIVVHCEHGQKEYALCPKFNVYINPTNKEVEMLVRIMRVRADDFNLKKSK